LLTPPIQEPKDGIVKLFDNKWQRVKNYVVYNKAGRKNLWLNDLIEYVRKGEKIVIPCNNAKVAHAIYEIISEQFPDKRDEGKF
jgi:hypothetical protein